MTCDQIQANLWRLRFSEPEAIFLVNILAWLGRHYREDISQMPPALRSYWEGRISHNEATTDNGLKESQEVLAEARTELRAERLDLIETWLREYEIAEVRDPWTVELSGEERDEFIAMLNDRRLLLALENSITERDMETQLSQIPQESRRTTIVEIDILGHFILVMLGPQIHRP